MFIVKKQVDLEWVAQETSRKYIHAVPPYKKRLYKKRLVDLKKFKKRRLVEKEIAKKRVS